ncbi:MAG: hypothetical protein F6K50_51485 [Moorea sp. SIO3I7]|nr:hypothetical protein [Moorena sp. SIO3I7]
MLTTHRKLSPIFYSNNHLRPVEAFNEVRLIRADQPWNEATETPRRDLSDHYPVYGHFEFMASSRAVMNSILWD